jgi:hypothetical protein
MCCIRSAACVSKPINWRRECLRTPVRIARAASCAVVRNSFSEYFRLFSTALLGKERRLADSCPDAAIFVLTSLGCTCDIQFPAQGCSESARRKLAGVAGTHAGLPKQTKDARYTDNAAFAGCFAVRRKYFRAVDRASVIDAHYLFIITVFCRVDLIDCAVNESLMACDTLPNTAPLLYLIHVRAHYTNQVTSRLRGSHAMDGPCD